jgi:hypothetical protein
MTAAAVDGPLPSSDFGVLHVFVSTRTERRVGKSIESPPDISTPSAEADGQARTASLGEG